MTGGPKRSERLHRVANVAHDSEKTAARRLAEAQRLVDESRRQLKELERYQDDYLALLKAAGKDATDSIESLRNHRAFLAHLVRAIDEQAERIREAEQQYSLRREEWLGERARAKALSKVVEQHRAAENRVADRRENREQDERAQRATLRWKVD